MTAKKQKTPNEFFKKFTPPKAAHFVSLGHACQLLEIVPNQLDVLMEASGVRFDEMRDGILYMTGTTWQRVVDQYNAIVAEVESVQASVANN